MTDQTEAPSQPPTNGAWKRNPWTCGALSLMCPGFGHVYLGHAERGALLAILVYMAIWLAAALGLLASFTGFALSALAMGTLYVGLAVDAFLLARRQTRFEPKFYNRIMPYALFALVLIGLPNYLYTERAKLLGFDRFTVGTEIMNPVLIVGDSILVDTTAYRGTAPAIGDLVAFQRPGNAFHVDIARIAGVAGDRVELQDGQVLRNGRVEPDLTVPASYRQETHSRDVPAQTVPEGGVWLLADWRDRARDSRFNGPYPAVGLIGRVTDIVWSPQRDRIGTSPR
ncbi:MAG: signal peptidase I [Chromatiales bacterium]|nr:signal peptidase I [Gammaproteobacteria bacterium]MCP5352951.1 signal peptidase I [Chromatiales bacterium]